ncbi:u6 snrna-associated sm-like protein lsm7 [Phaffia rhodozyma]|uniref:U6 snrna-associated sm-like protein lsm7 n=1 Tax=Phaffia rhodozyma TaxID=264483 RepID=A0A0F7SPV5_PHARH|nr:u6 snrna-associated sm-like protein lsm7 [Phaffia rhodozyma]
MSDRGRGAPRGRGGPSSRGGRGGNQNAGGGGPSGEKPKREAILDMGKYVDKKIRVKFTGGREVVGTLKGYDQLLNLVLDDVEEEVLLPTPHTRSLGLVVLRGPTIVLLSPMDGSEGSNRKPVLGP